MQLPNIFETKKRAEKKAIFREEELLRVSKILSKDPELFVKLLEEFFRKTKDGKKKTLMIQHYFSGIRPVFIMDKFGVSGGTVSILLKSVRQYVYEICEEITKRHK